METGKTANASSVRAAGPHVDVVARKCHVVAARVTDDPLAVRGEVGCHLLREFTALAEGPVDVNTSGGSITLDNIAGPVKAETSGGGISANITKLTGNLILETSGGSIRATIPSGLGLNLDLSADHIDTKLTNFSGTSKRDKINGQMNGGGIPVRISTSGGSITLDYK